jgi:hypothetical protein
MVPHLRSRCSKNQENSKKNEAPQATPAESRPPGNP